MFKYIFIHLYTRRFLFRDKFILSVSIIADMGKCPQTPPPEATTVQITPTPTAAAAVAAAAAAVATTTAAVSADTTSGNNNFDYNSSSRPLDASTTLPSCRKTPVPYHLTQTSSPSPLPQSASFQSSQDEFRTAVPTEV